ncbi:MAG: GIY-YIG nuclease family protein [Candidatus Margulisiibacteriota bacterium]
MEYCVYVLKSVSHRTRYVGSTRDIKARLEQHNTGKVRYTSGRRPWVLVYTEEYSSRSEAMRREKSLKTGSGRAELNGILVE